MKISMEKFFNKIIKFSIYLLVFLMPLFWLPFSFEVFEFNKQYLLFFLTSIAFLSWLLRMALVDKEIRLKRTPLDILVVAFLFIAILSGIFSLDKTSSIFGFYGRFSDGLIGLLSLGMLFFLITNNVGIEAGVKKEKEENDLAPSSIISIRGLLSAFLLAVFFVILTSYFSIFGIWTKLNQVVAAGAFPPIMLQKTFNPISGSMEGLTIFLSIALVLTVGLFLLARKKLAQFFYLGLLVLGLGLLIIVDYNPAWMILLVSFSLSLVFVLVKRIFREDINRLLLPIFFIIISAIFLISNVNFQSQNFQLPKEWVLSSEVSWKVAINTAMEDIKSKFFGSGIGTFHYDFAKKKPLEINQTWLWQIRFDKAGSHMSEILGTMGFLGLFSYLALVVVFLLISLFLTRRKSKEEDESSNLNFQLPLLMTFFALATGEFVYYQNTVLAFVFWLVLGLGVVSWKEPLKEKVLSFKDFPELSLIFSTSVIILGIIIVSVYYFGVKFYLADVNYNKSLAVLGQERIEKLERAVSLNPLFSQYKVVLSRTYLFEASQELRKSLTEQDGAKIQVLIGKAIDEAKRVVDLQPKSVVSWENSGVVYREIIGIAAGAADWSMNSFEKAIELEPTNPVLYTELGKLYLAKNDNGKAKEYFQKAIEKKSDYADAIIQLALILEKENVLDEAIKRLEDLVSKDPWNFEAYFQLGRLYFNAGRVDQAIEIFQIVTRWMPQYSNALYSLGVAYSAKGQTQEAIKAFEKVLELNPGNQDVIQKLEELKKREKQGNNEELKEKVELKKK